MIPEQIKKLKYEDQVNFFKLRLKKRLDELLISYKNNTIGWKQLIMSLERYNDAMDKRFLTQETMKALLDARVTFWHVFAESVKKAVAKGKETKDENP